MKNYAIMDFSIGSISLLIAGVEGRSQEIIFKTKEHCPLSEYVTQAGRLKGKGIDRLLETADSLIRMARNLNVERIHAISTTLLRNLGNADEVEERIREATGLELVNLTGLDEAYAVYTANARYRILDRAVLMHMGSSATEICDYERPKKDAMLNLDFGSDTLSRDFVRDLFPDDDELKAIREHVCACLDERRDITGNRKFENAVLAGTNAEAIYKVYRDYYDIGEEKDPLMQTSKLKKLRKALMKEKKRSRLLLDNVPEQAYLVIPVLEALIAMLEHFDINDITVSSLGVKEGWFRYMMDRNDEKRETTD